MVHWLSNYVGALSGGQRIERLARGYGGSPE